MEIKLSDHFTGGRLVRFCAPSIVMMVFTSIYGMVDGFFVSNYVGKTPFAALNLIWPFFMVIGCIGFMFGTGGVALVSKTMGEGDVKRANRLFSLLTYSVAAVSIVLGILGVAVMRPVASLLGAEGEMLDQAVLYGSIIMGGVSTFVLQVFFQPFMVAAERPRLGLWMTVASGCTNMVLDWVLIGIFDMGLVGAASATLCSQVVGMLWPLLYFAFPNGSPLRLGRPVMDFAALGKACSNGLSEFVTNVALSVVSMIYNLQLLRLAGEDGVASYGVIMYVAMLFLAVFFGFTMGSSPVVSYHYGAGNRKELHSLLRLSLLMMGSAALVMTAAAVLSSGLIARVFTGYEEALCALTQRAFWLYSLSFLLSFYNIFTSAFFTALNNGVVSAVVSFSRMFVFQITAVLALPLVLGLDGIWLAMPVSEVCSSVVSTFFLLKYRNKYGY